MLKNVTIDRDVSVKITFDSIIYTDLSYYARDNIPIYQIITEIPKEYMDYINSVKYAINCEYMFKECRSLTSLELSSFDTRYVTNMGSMFYNCKSLTSLDLSNFNTGNVTNMNNMFYNCESLTSLDLSNFNTSNVTSMIGMFYYCYSLITIKGPLDLSSCETVTGMFDNSPDLKGVHLKNVPRSLLDTDGSLKNAQGTLNETYIIDNILEGK